MKTRHRLGGRRLQSTSIVALAIGAGFAALATGPAHAAGTLADTLVTNDVTVTYDVGGTPQTPEVSQETFRVDRMIDIQVTATDDTVYPGEDETTATLVYTVQNQGNDFQSIDLFAVEFSDTMGSGLTLSPDSTVDIGEYALFIDNNNDGVLDAGDTWLDPAQTLDIIALAPDATVQILLVAEIPLDATDTSFATYDLVAVSVTNTGDPEIEDVPGIDTTDRVFVDDAYAGNYTTDIAEDGQHSDAGTFNVTSADVTAAKTVKIIDRDPTVNCATAPQDPDPLELYAIPGACIEYTITVTNTGATIVATDVAISDVLPAEVTFVAFHTDTSADFTNSEVGDVAPAEAAGTVSATEATLAAGESIQLVVRATVN